MAIAFDAVGQAGSSFASTLTKAHTCSGTNRFIAVLVCKDRASETIDSCTYGGVSMTAQHATANHTSGYCYRLFTLAGDGDVASGSNNIVATYSGAGAKPFMVFVSYNGVDSAAPVSDVTTGSATGLNPTWTVDSATDDLVVALFSHTRFVAAELTPGTNTTEREDVLTDVINFGAIVLDEPGAASVTIDGTWGASNTEWYGTAFSLKAAGGGSAVPPTNRLSLLGVG